MSSYPTWGVDITSTGIRAVQIDLDDEGAPRITGWDVVDFTEEVEDPQSLARFAVIARGLGHFRQRHDLDRTRVWVSLRSEAAFHRSVSLPAVDDQSLDKLLDYEAQQQIPYALEEVHWDRRVLEIDPKGHVRVAIYALKRSLVLDRLRKLAKMRCPVDGLQIRALALQNFCAQERLLDPGTVVIDVDYASLTLLVHDGLETWFHTMPLGGYDLVQQLRENMRLDHRKAVRTAAAEPGPKDTPVLATARAAVAEMLAEEVSSRLRFYCGARPEVALSNVVLFHSHRTVPPLQGAMKRALGLPVHVPRGFRQLPVDPGAVTAGIQEHFGSLVKAAGLALQGAGRAEVDIKLFDQAIGREIGKRRWTWVAAAALLVGLFVLGALRASRSHDRLAVARQDAQAVAADAQPRGAVVERTDPAADLQIAEQLSAEFAEADGPLPLVDHLWSRIAAWTEGEAPRLVGLEWSNGSRPGRLVLATREGASGAAGAEALLRDFARSLGAGGGITELRSTESWSAGGLTVAAPNTPPTPGTLRRTYRHMAFEFDRSQEGVGR